MKFIQRTVELKWPILLVELFFLIGGILLLISGIKLRKQNRIIALICVVTGSLLTLISLYILLITVIFGYNS
ncbi:hypothetical protein Q783_06080 [Carnobacterium inhibens subsp. gilichinskyi]|uniref:Uncharacterized protein n=1 Tax=Carnobacterium inhibens subsp. gilichinskyi TaxID=1266845 RepID=U5SBZ1_9LACT|nr:hypothetical protein Q783_06080 [Carnobacterium inhibens subsp. gilichinskyi]